MTREELARSLRLIVVTDARLAASRGRTVETAVESALAAGARAIQLREKEAPAAVLLDRARRLRALTREAGALLFVNDRLDVALAAGADGVHLGAHDLPVAAARDASGHALLVGYSADDPEEAKRAQEDGADYLGCGDVFGTASKADAGDVIGLERLDEVARAVTIPVVAIGGITVPRAAEVAATAAAGTAAMSAAMAADDVGEAVGALLSFWAGR